MFHSHEGQGGRSGAACAAALLTAGVRRLATTAAATRLPATTPTLRSPLTVGTFGTMDFDNAGLYDQYMKLHPNVTIKENNIAQSANYYKALQTHLAASSGLDDIQALEIGFVADVVQNHSDAFVDFAAEDNGDELKGNFYDWKWGQATTDDGQTIGLGTDAGPQAMCYRKDLFQQAGLPTDRAQVGQLWTTLGRLPQRGPQYKTDHRQALRGQPGEHLLLVGLPGRPRLQRRRRQPDPGHERRGQDGLGPGQPGRVRGPDRQPQAVR